MYVYGRIVSPISLEELNSRYFNYTECTITFTWIQFSRYKRLDHWLKGLFGAKPVNSLQRHRSTSRYVLIKINTDNSSSEMIS